MTIPLALVGCGKGDSSDASAQAERTPIDTSSAAVQRPEASERPLIDFDIGTAVRDELGTEHGISSDEVEIDVKDGVVTLTGALDSFAQTRRATQRAELIRGVKSVINELEVASSERPDWDIRSGVIEALRDEPATTPHVPDVSVDDGVVTLRGEVSSWALRALDEQAPATCPASAGSMTNWPSHSGPDPRTTI